MGRLGVIKNFERKVFIAQLSVSKVRYFKKNNLFFLNCSIQKDL